MRHEVAYEVVGGLWVLLLSIAALKSKSFPKALNYLGLFIGIAGVLTIYPADVLTEIFGLGQIVWFIWLGTIMLTKPSNDINLSKEQSIIGHLT